MFEESSLYDIQPLPVFAYEPSTAHWAVLITLTALLLCFYFLRKKFLQKRAFPPSKAVDLALRELEQLQADIRDSSQVYDRASLITRRLISHLLGLPAQAYTLHELHELADTSPKNIKAVLAALFPLESARYRHDSALSKQILTLLIDAIRDIKNTPSTNQEDEEESRARA